MVSRGFVSSDSNFFFFGGHKGGYRENERITFMFLNKTILTEELGSILNE